MQNEINELPSNIPVHEAQSETPQPNLWKTSDTWVGLAILLLLISIYLTINFYFELANTSSFLLLIIPELLMLIPIAIIFTWRKVSWKELGFFKFKPIDLALGVGLLLVVYFFSIINNIVMLLLGIITQAETIFEVLSQIDSLALFALTSMVLAPIIEEIFFRGFLFNGFRQKYDWKIALVISSLIFSLFHGQVATLIPTFLLGALFSYMVHRTKSILPGMILHFLVNSVGTCGLLVAYQFGGI